MNRKLNIFILVALLCGMFACNKPKNLGRQGDIWGGVGGSISQAGGTVSYGAGTTVGSSADNGLLVKLSASSACSYTLPNPQPSTTWHVWIQSVGSTTCTVGLGTSMTYNGVASAPALIKNDVIYITADSGTSTNYAGRPPLAAATGTRIVANNNSLNVEPFLNNHQLFAGSPPTLGTCGTSPSISGNDNVFAITVGTGTVTSCAISSFTTTFTTAPACTVEYSNTTLGAHDISAVSTSAITFSWTTSDPGVVIYVHCF